MIMHRHHASALVTRRHNFVVDQLIYEAGVMVTQEAVNVGDSRPTDDALHGHAMVGVEFIHETGQELELDLGAGGVLRMAALGGPALVDAVVWGEKALAESGAGTYKHDRRALFLLALLQAVEVLGSQREEAIAVGHKIIHKLGTSYVTPLFDLPRTERPLLAVGELDGVVVDKPRHGDGRDGDGLVDPNALLLGGGVSKLGPHGLEVFVLLVGIFTLQEEGSRDRNAVLAALLSRKSFALDHLPQLEPRVGATDVAS
mmetsp:Transcript_20429/g.36436  ORF Transcript_20429/g.36436 Transcript_20429/m.36436 type:complete len:258 (-) Transcript_20429:393-1166(-)